MSVLVQMKIVTSKSFQHNQCFNALSLGGSSIRPFHLKYIMSHYFETTSPLRNAGALQKIVHDLLEAPILKSTIEQLQIIRKVEAFQELFKYECNEELLRSINRLLAKWKLIATSSIVHHSTYSIPLTSDKCQLFCEYFHVSFELMTEAFDLLCKHSLLLHSGSVLAFIEIIPN